MSLEPLKVKVPKFFVATVIIVSAIGFPAYFLSGEKMSAPSVMQWIIFFLYTIIVITFTLMGLGVKGINITSEETDKRIKQKKAVFDKAVKPYVFIAFAAALLWFAYSIIGLQKNT